MHCLTAFGGRGRALSAIVGARRSRWRRRWVALGCGGGGVFSVVSSGGEWGAGGGVFGGSGGRAFSEVGRLRGGG